MGAYEEHHDTALTGYHIGAWTMPSGIDVDSPRATMKNHATARNSLAGMGIKSRDLANDRIHTGLNSFDPVESGFDAMHARRAVMPEWGKRGSGCAWLLSMKHEPMTGIRRPGRSAQDRAARWSETGLIASRRVR